MRQGMTFRLGARLPRWGFEMPTSAFNLRDIRDEDLAATSGTAFGSDAAMLQPTPRQRERRQAFADLLEGLTRALDRRNDISLMRGAFEELMRRVVPVRSIQLREAGSRWVGRHDACGAESFAVEVPGADPVNAGVLEATFDPSCGLGEWDFQILGLAAHLGALVLEIERSRLHLARAGLWAPTRMRRDGAAPLIGSTPIMAALRGSIERVSVTDFTVLLEGESGVGKELVARQIHELSRRRNGPFVAINCAALVETLLEAELFGIEDRTATGVRGRRGKFEAADGGTLFLDEVSDLSLSAQAKLLRTIQDLAIERVGGQGAHRVDIRIVAATNRSLAGLVERGLFRTDLFYRLSGVDIRVPTLRERRPDVLELAHYFLQRHRSARSLRLSTVAAHALVHYDWPGNVRELERMVERAVALAESDVIDLDDLPPRVRGEYAAVLGPSLRRDDTLRTWASRYARLVLDRCHDNKREACRVLGISYHKLQAYLRYPAADPAWTDTETPMAERSDEACLTAAEQAV
jgi:two-component system, NtrC family, response regulator HydG